MWYETQLPQPLFEKAGVRSSKLGTSLAPEMIVTLKSFTESMDEEGKFMELWARLDSRLLYKNATFVLIATRDDKMTHADGIRVSTTPLVGDFV